MCTCITVTLSTHLFSSVQLLSCVQLLAIPWTEALQAYLSITNTWSILKLMSIKSAMSSNHIIFYHLLLLLPLIFPRMRVFYSESVLHIRWQKYWSFSFSISTPNEYSGMISLGLTGLVSLQSKGLSRVFSNIKSINSSVLSFLYGPNYTSIHDYWKNHSFDYTDLCQQGNVSAF